MNYLLLGITALSVTVQNILKKSYNKRCSGGVFCFSGMISLCAMLFFIAVNREWYYLPRLLLPSFLFAVFYATATVGAVLAIRHGSLAISSLVISCSLLVPSFYGILWLGEPISLTLVLGTVLLVVSLVLTNYEKRQGEKKRISLLWIIFLILAFIGNGMCSTMQKIKLITYGDEGNNCYMIVALAMVTVVMFALALCVREERRFMGEAIQKGWLLALISGLFNGMTNFLVIYLTPHLPASVMFPVISAGSLAMVFAYALIVEKERFSLWQKVGFFVGLASIVLLNL